MMSAEKLLAKSMRMPLCVVRDVYIARVREETARIDESREWLRTHGYDELHEVDESQILRTADAEYLPDGRVLVRAQKKLWAMTAELWEKQRAEAIAAGVNAERSTRTAQQHQGQQTTCATLIDGQLCGGTLVRAQVCPRCALGKSGVVATLTCDVCGHVTAIMREAE